MSEQNEIKNSIQPWIVSLGISVFCCALFFAFMSSYVGSINKSLSQIDERLAGMEARALAAASAPTPAPTVAVPVVVPAVQAPPIDSPASVVGSGAPTPTPTPTPVPEGSPTPLTPPAEAVAPVLPSVSPAAAPVPAGEPEQQ